MEGHRENLGPETREPVIAVVVAEKPDGFKRCDVRRKPNGEGREDNMERHREGELDPGEDCCVQPEKHGGPPG
jgi:hypothetical protein